MSKQTLFRQQMVQWVTKKLDPPWAENDSFYVSLHHDAPVWTNDQTTYEISYTGYARQPIARSELGWTFASSSASNATEIVFPTPTDSLQEVWWVGLGTAASGPGQLLYYTNVFEEVFLAAVGQPIVIPVGGLTVRET